MVTAGQGAGFPATPFNATVWPAGSQPLASNAEIVRVTNISTDTFTITRTAESTSARSILVGDQIAAAITAQTLTDIENLVLTGERAILLGKGGAIQATDTNAADFPVAVPFNCTLLRMKVTMKVAPAGAMVVQLRSSANPITTAPTYSDVSGFSVTFTGSNVLAVVDPANVNLSEGDFLNFSCTTGSGSNLLVECVVVLR